MIVISRSTEESFGYGRNIRRYKELIKEQFSADEILTYDDLVARANKLTWLLVVWVQMNES